MPKWYRVLSDEDFPSVGLAVLLMMVVLTLGFTWALLFAIPSEQRVMKQGTHAIAHATTYTTYDRKHGTYYYANLSWQDAQGHPKTYDDLAIGQHAYNVIQASRDGTTEILYIDDVRPVVVADTLERENQDAIVWIALPILVLVTLLFAHYVRRRLREWRDRDKPAPVPW